MIFISIGYSTLVLHPQVYYKGASMLHTIRQVINDDEKFRQILRGLGKEFYHQTVTGKQVQDYINQKSGIDFSTVFFGHKNGLFTFIYGLFRALKQ